MIKNKKQMFIVIGIFTLVLMLGTVTYAFFNYTRTGTANTIRVGRISFITRQTNTINLTNMFPIDPTETGIMDDDNKVGTLEIEIEGDTDYAQGVEYLISSVGSNIYTNQGKLVPISLNVTIDDLGTSNSGYFTARESKNATIYKQIVGDTLLGNQMLLVGYIKPNTTSGTKEGINGSITIKAYFDKNKIVISDTYDGTESDNMGTTTDWVGGKTVITTSEWNALQSSGVSFKVKVEANEGIWVNPTLGDIMQNSSRGIDSDSGIDFSSTPSMQNTNGVYLRSGTENNINPIYYYRGAVDNNIVFGDKCWKAIRTTDNGGVRLIYNGETTDGYVTDLLPESSYSKTQNNDSRWTFDSSDKSWNITLNDNSHPIFEVNVPTGNHYSMDMTGTSGSSCGGIFTFYKNDSQVAQYGAGSGNAMNLSYNFGTLNSTDVIKMNYGGSSSETCTITFKIKMTAQTESVRGCDNTGYNSQITVGGENMFKFNANANSPSSVGYMYGAEYNYNSGLGYNAYYSEDFTYANGVYSLTNPTKTRTKTTRYSCNKTTADGTCETIRYYYYISNYDYYYILISNGKSGPDALKEMQRNINDSIPKDVIDTWFENNMLDYINEIDDVIYCNEKGNTSNGFIPSNIGDDTLKFNNSSPIVTCGNLNDSFGVNVGNKSLKYPVGMITLDEAVLAGATISNKNIKYYLYTGKDYWTMSPNKFITYGLVYSIDDGGMLYSVNVDHSEGKGIRPVISIKPGLSVIRGTGTVLDPYVVE